MAELEKFRALGISEGVLDALRQKGFEEPSPIQELTIPLLLKGERDVIGQAQTGTGKTAAFGIPIIDTIRRGDGNPKALILAPTRELSIQIAEELNSLKGNSNLRIAPFYGGQFIGVQLKKLDEGIDIVIGTPGRIIDLMEREKLILDEIQFAVLDEADEMLDMGFVDDIKRILSAAPAEKRMLMFSATMPEEILAIAEQFMRPDYEIVRTKTETVSTDLTEQIYYEVRREHKLEVLSRIIDMEDDLYAMVFCKTRSDVDELTDALTARGYAVDALHGDIAQAQRTRVINNFKARKFRLLIATDVAARGIDVNDLTHVIKEKCACGRTTARMQKVRSRCDDMLIIRGTNVFPSQVEDVLSTIEGVTPHYRIVVDNETGLDRMVVHVELKPEAFSDSFEEMDAFRRMIEEKLKSVMLVASKVKLVEPGGIERSTGKTKHVQDLRK